MWVSSKLLCLYAFSATANADTYMGQPLKFYKGMRFPWNIKEAPESYDHTIPTVNYTWDWYFEYLVKSGADSFQLGGYAIEESKVVLEPDFYDPWNITGFMSLRKQVDAAGGEILADTRFYLDYGNNTFDKATFLKSASEFLKDYPVDGFQVGLSLPTDPKQYQPLKELIEAIKELNVRACLELTILPSDWQKMNGTGIAEMVDRAVIMPWPAFRDPKAAENFNTDRFAEDLIKNAVKVGLNPNKLILVVPLLARSDSESSDIGYSNAIYDLGADPRGNGSAFLNGTGYFFFSQTRAIEKVALAKKYGLHGIGLEGGESFESEDLYPWDANSLFHAIALSSGRRLTE